MEKGFDYPGVSIVYFCHDGHGNFLMQKRGNNCRDEIGKWDIGAGSLDFGDVGDTEDLKIKVGEMLGFPETEDWKILEKVLSNYIDMNIKSIDYKNEYELIKFVKSCYYFIKTLQDTSYLIRIYSDDWYNRFLESTHPSENQRVSHQVLINLSKYLDSSKGVAIRKLKKFAILVEGESDEILISAIFKGLGVLGIDFYIKNYIRFIRLESSSRIDFDRIKDHLKRFKESDFDYFLFLDGDAKEKADKLVEESLIDKNNIIIFDKEIENELPLKEVIKEIETLKPELKDIFDLNIIKREFKNPNKNLKKILEDYVYSKNKSLDFNGIKIPIAKKFSIRIKEELEESIKDESGAYRGDFTPKSKKYNKIVEKLRPIANKINKISSDFFVVKKIN